MPFDTICIQTERWRYCSERGRSNAEKQWTWSKICVCFHVTSEFELTLWINSCSLTMDARTVHKSQLIYIYIFMWISLDPFLKALACSFHIQMYIVFRIRINKSESVYACFFHEICFLKWICINLNSTVAIKFCNLNFVLLNSSLLGQPLQ